MANPEHLASLKRGVEEWNAWRNKQAYVRPDLSQVDFGGRDLRGADFSGTDLSGVNLRGVILAKGVFESIDANGVACFSVDPRSMLLWSYYAEGHAGVAVRFNTTPSVLARITHHVLPLRVGYQDDFPKISYYTATRADLVTTVLGTKSLAWAHEQEWRLVLVGRSGSMKVPAAMIDGVVLGMRIDPSHEETVRGWVDGRTPKIELLRVVHKPGSFALDLVPAWSTKRRGAG